MTEATLASEASVHDKAGKYLTFALGPEEYGLEIMKVREIIGYINVTSVPQTPDHVTGVINLRGKVIPIINLRSRFGMETIEATDEACIIVVEVNRVDSPCEIGIVVDNVSEVLDITYDQLEDAPEFGAEIQTDFILGMGKIGESVKMLLDIDKVLSGTEIAQLIA